MIEVFIRYNPYKLETEIMVEGKAPKQNSALHVEDRRLQEWVEDLPRILTEEYNSRTFSIEFHGTTLDFEDLALIASNAESEGVRITCRHTPAKEVMDKEKLIQAVFEDIRKGPFEELRQPDILRAFEAANNAEFPVNVLATMSAGKSTLINAMLNKKLMPARQEACTAIITEIKDCDLDRFRAFVFGKSNEHLKTSTNLTLEDMEEFNSDPEVSTIRVEGDIPFLSSEDMALILVDTPGPNNSRDPEHQATTYRMIRDSSKTLVLYILNATQLAVNDDSRLLSHVAESMIVGGKQSKDRFLFVVNKLDDFKQGEDSVKNSIDKVRTYLESKGIKNPNIFPASALTALDIRTTLHDVDVKSLDMNTAEDGIFEVVAKIRKINRNPDLHLETYAPLSPSLRKEIGGMLSQARADGDPKREALIHTGIIPIEAAIRMYVEKYARTAKIKNLVDTFSRRLESSRAMEKTKESIAIHSEERDQIRAQIDAIEAKLRSGEEGKKFRDELARVDRSEEIKEIARSVTDRAQEEVSRLLSGCDEEITEDAAKAQCQYFKEFAQRLQSEIKVELEEMINNFVQNNAQGLLNEYRSRIADLAKDLDVGKIAVDPFELIAGNMGSGIDAAALVQEMVREKKVGEEWVENTDKAWWKPWTWFDKDGWYEDVYKNVVNGSQLAQRFFAPIQKQLMDGEDRAIRHAQKQMKEIKAAFNEKFKELDSVLDRKLQELKDCATDQIQTEKFLEETRQKLAWLEDIQLRVQSILEI